MWIYIFILVTCNFDAGDTCSWQPPSDLQNSSIVFRRSNQYEELGPLEPVNEQGLFLQVELPVNATLTLTSDNIPAGITDEGYCFSF